MNELFTIVTIGLVSGFLSGLLGIGGGFIMVPALIIFVGLSPHHAIGASLAVIVPTAISGVFKHYSLGNVDFRMAAMVAVGAVVGSYIGATTTAYVSGDTLKKIFGVFTVLVGCNMLFGYTGKIGNPDPAGNPDQLIGN